jgi:hypothetical protein
MESYNGKRFRDEPLEKHLAYEANVRRRQWRARGCMRAMLLQIASATTNRDCDFFA